VSAAVVACVCGSPSAKGFIHTTGSCYRRPEPTRVREQGTHVTDSRGDPLARIDAIRAIVTAKQYAKVDGVMVDLFTASAIVAVYDGLNETNRAKYAAMPVGQMGVVAFRLVK
jgi:hypothetical protein